MAGPFDDLFPQAGTPGGALINWLQGLIRPDLSRFGGPGGGGVMTPVDQIPQGPLQGPAMPPPGSGPMYKQEAPAQQQAQGGGQVRPGSGTSPIRTDQTPDNTVASAVPNPGGAATRQAGPPVGGTASAGGNPVGANMMRYPTANPTFALQSAMLAMGLNPFRADPVMGQLMSYAPGLAQAFMLGNLGGSASDIAARGGEGQMFGDFLRSTLGQTGGLTSALSSAASGLPGALNQLTAIQDQIAANGGSLVGVNPFAQALMSIYDDPQGAAGAFGALTTPFMSQGVGQAYQRGLGNVAGQALRRRLDDYEQSIEPRNFWEYLFPNL